MATTSYNMTDTAQSCALTSHCSTVGGTVEIGKQVSDATIGTGVAAFSVGPGLTDDVHFSYEVILVAGTTMDADDATIILNFTTGDMDVTWESVFICHRNSSCANITTLGSATGLGITSNSGQQQTVVSCSSATFTTGDVVIIVCGFSESAGHSAGNIQVTMDQTMTLPWNPPVAGGFGALLSDKRHKLIGAGLIA